MSLTALESKLANLADTLIEAAANMVAAKNPAYSTLITLGSGLVDSINQEINPTAAGAATQIAAAATAISSAVTPVTSGVTTIGSSAATATAKASAAGIILGDVETIATSIKALF